MSIKERVQEIFNRFNVDLQVTEEKVEMAEATLDNGTVIYTDDENFNEGSEAYIINDEGERIALPPGDYTLENGTTIKIGEGGVVTAVGGEESSEEETPEETPTEEPIKEESEQEDEVVETPMSRDEIVAMVREIVSEMMSEDKEEEKMSSEEVQEEVTEEVLEEKEELSEVNPEAPKGVDEVVEEKPKKKSKKEVVEDPTEDAVMTELAEVKKQLFELQKKAAERGLKHRAPVAKKEAVNLTNLSTEERVRALIKHYNA